MLVMNSLPFFTVCPAGMQSNTNTNINNNEQRCIACPSGWISDGKVANGGCTDCSTSSQFANVQQTACIGKSNFLVQSLTTIWQSP